MNESRLELLWNDIPIGIENAVSYDELQRLWNIDTRMVRRILHDLSAFDNGDDYVLIRSARSKGFYRTDDIDEIKAFRQECLNKGRSLFAPVKKINRVINANSTQFEIENNMRIIRESRNMKQAEVCRKLKMYDNAIDKSMLSKMENSVCLPTPYQLSIMAKIYDCEPADLVNGDLYFWKELK